MVFGIWYCIRYLSAYSGLFPCAIGGKGGPYQYEDAFLGNFNFPPLPPIYSNLHEAMSGKTVALTHLLTYPQV